MYCVVHTSRARSAAQISARVQSPSRLLDYKIVRRNTVSPRKRTTTITTVAEILRPYISFSVYPPNRRLSSARSVSELRGQVSLTSKPPVRPVGREPLAGDERELPGKLVRRKLKKRQRKNDGRSRRRTCLTVAEEELA